MSTTPLAVSLAGLALAQETILFMAKKNMISRDELSALFKNAREPHVGLDREGNAQAASLLVDIQNSVSRALPSHPGAE